jgi:hypothetical protein
VGFDDVVDCAECGGYRHVHVEVLVAAESAAEVHPRLLLWS